MGDNDYLIIVGQTRFLAEPGWITCMDPQGVLKWSQAFTVDFTFSSLLPKRVFSTANGYLIFHEGGDSTFESPGKIIAVDTAGQATGNWDLIVNPDSSGAFTDMQIDPAGCWLAVILRM